MLGIPTSYYVLPTLIYRRLTSFGPTLISEVGVLAVIVGLIGVSVIMIQSLFARRVEARLITKPGATLFLPIGRWRPVVETVLWIIIVLILVLPLTALVATALVPAYGVPLSAATVTLDNFVEVIFRQQATARAFVNSGFLASLAAVILAVVAVTLAYFQVWRRVRLARFLSVVADIPYSLPGVVLSIAMILVFLKPIPLLGVSLYGTLWIILVAYLGRFLALALRPVVAGFEQLDPRLEEAARVAGAHFGMRMRTVTVPLLGPVAAAGAILVFVTAVNELTVSALLWSSGQRNPWRDRLQPRRRRLYRAGLGRRRGHGRRGLRADAGGAGIVALVAARGPALVGPDPEIAKLLFSPNCRRLGGRHGPAVADGAVHRGRRPPAGSHR